MNQDLSNQSKAFLIFTTIVVGMCSIIYELLISTTASYFMGDSIRQFSIIIGVYMASMGIGSYLSRFFVDRLVYHFVLIEIILGIVGAFSVPLCYLYFAWSDYEGFTFFVLFYITLIGTLTGLEIPLLTRMLEGVGSLRANIANILSFDYLGALIATLLFPFFLVPFVGLFKSSLIFGMINILIGVLTYLVFRPSIGSRQGGRLVGVASTGALLILSYMLVQSGDTVTRWNAEIFKHDVLYEEESPYQNIILTKGGNELRMYLNGAIQFSSRDEYRYHEALVHLPMMQVATPSDVLVLGGGEGLAVRELLKHQYVKRITVVDLDPAVSKLASTMPMLVALNDGAMADPRVQVINEDAFRYLMRADQKYDIILCDLPDPTSESLARLYSNAFYKLALARLWPSGVLATQATSPELTTNAFWCINRTIQEAGFAHTYPYQVNVPAFGNWGFVLATQQGELQRNIPAEVSTVYLDSAAINHMLYFPKDKLRSDILPNNLDQPILLDYYIDHWRSLQGTER